MGIESSFRFLNEAKSCLDFFSWDLYWTIRPSRCLRAPRWSVRTSASAKRFHSHSFLGVRKEITNVPPPRHSLFIYADFFWELYVCDLSLNLNAAPWHYNSLFFSLFPLFLIKKRNNAILISVTCVFVSQILLACMNIHRVIYVCDDQNRSARKI